MTSFKTYIKVVTGFDMIPSEKDKDYMFRLPLFINEGYQFTPVLLNDREIVFVQPKLEELPNPAQLQKQLIKIEEAMECPAVVVLRTATHYLKEQLVKNKIAFVIPGQQLFMPFMFISLKEQQETRIIKVEAFSPATQFMVIYHLYSHKLENMNLKEIADACGYSSMTISRSVQELEAAKVCKVIGSKSKQIQFEDEPIHIWNAAKNYMTSPVKKKEWLFDFEQNHVKTSGLHALSQYSNISSGRVISYAIHTDLFTELKKTGDISVTIDNERDMELEIWSYDPIRLAVGKQIVDPFSLYLSMQDDEDERTQMELENMLEDWLYGRA
tara:strand:- start:3530 stop:4510 length:981 start_codon:yes stop_codon:yes gene_type:complete